jgi:hypothetical protein
MTAITAMTRNQMLDLTTQLLGGFVLGADDFDRLLLIAQVKYELKREWQILKKIDDSILITAANSYLTLNTLPEDFIRLTSDNPVKLYGAAGDVLNCKQIPMEQRLSYKNNFGYFYLDYAQNKIAFTGSPQGTYTAQLSYLYKPADINENTLWAFPGWCHAILPYDIAVNYKGGIDYDSISESQARYNQQELDEIWDFMVDWDCKLQTQALDGLERNQDGINFTPNQVQNFNNGGY